MTPPCSQISQSATSGPIALLEKHKNISCVIKIRVIALNEIFFLHDFSPQCLQHCSELALQAKHFLTSEACSTGLLSCCFFRCHFTTDNYTKHWKQFVFNKSFPEMSELAISHMSVLGQRSSVFSTVLKLSQRLPNQELFTCKIQGLNDLLWAKKEINEKNFHLEKKMQTLSSLTTCIFWRYDQNASRKVT